MLHYALSLSVLCLLFGASVEAEYEPDVLVEALFPKGLRVSIPDETGISLFAFHGKINEEVINREAGTYSVDIRSAKNGRWTYFQPNVQLQPGDVIYYWVNVDYDDGTGNRGYIKDDQAFTITELLAVDTGVTSTTTTTTVRTPRTTRTTRTPRTTRPPTTKTTTATPQCKPTHTKVNGKRSCQGKLIFQDNFGDFRDKKWYPEIKFAGDPDYEFVIYENNPDNFYYEKNKLVISPTLLEDKYGKGYVSNSTGINLGAQCTGVRDSVDCHLKPKAWVILPPVISAQLTTKDHFSFLYGVVEIRARLPQGDWVYPELYLRSRGDDYGPGMDSGMIRIAFTPGNTDDTSKELSGGCVLGESATARSYGIKSIRSEKNWNNDFHIFKVEWKTDSITLMVDDTVYNTIYPPNGGFASEESNLELDPATASRWRKGSVLAPFDKPMYLTLGVGVGGQCFPNRDDGTKPWDNNDPKSQLTFYRAQDIWSETWSEDSSLLVDYVKVWAL